MKGKTEHWGWKSAPQQKPSPCDGYKHACVPCRGFVYLHGGWNTTSLRDFWRYNIAKNEWEMLDCSGDGSEELEEHLVVAFKGNLYIFGGMADSAFTQAKTPLWTCDIGMIHNNQFFLWDIPNLQVLINNSTRWTECRNVPAEKESLAPANRKGHSAVVYHSSMYIFGGYFGIKGISQELWTFHFDTGKCLCVSSPSQNTSPGPRHGRSAVLCPTGMYLFGGLMGLSEQKDLWKWDFVSSNWSNIRTSLGPSPVVGHASTVCKDSLLIFGGGISNSSPNDDLWKYHFHMQTRKKLSSTANFPPTMYHCILGTGVDFQTTSDFTNTSPSHWKNDQKDHGQLVPILRHTRFGNSFRQWSMDGALGSKESNTTEMKTFSLPLEPVGSCAFQTTSEAELDPNRDIDLLLKDKSLPLFPSSERETLAAAQVVGKEEGSDPVTAGDELGSHTSTLLFTGDKPLSSFAEISFRQMEFDSL